MTDGALFAVVGSRETACTGFLPGLAGLLFARPKAKHPPLGATGAWEAVIWA